eukprot:1849535-Pleurochrysis_carterae.AAC.1
MSVDSVAVFLERYLKSKSNAGWTDENEQRKRWRRPKSECAEERGWGLLLKRRDLTEEVKGDDGQQCTR